MDTLKHAAVVIRRSPQLVRKKFEKRRSKHEPLEDDWLHQRENLEEGVTFYVKRLGTSPITVSQGPGCTDEAVKQAIEEYKKNRKSKSDSKLQKFAMHVSSRSLRLEDAETKELVEDIPIYRMSYCTADAHYTKVFTFISRPQGENNLFCHVLLTNKTAMAEAIALTVSQCFTIAYENWQTRAKSIKRRTISKIEDDMEQEAPNLYGDIGKFFDGTQQDSNCTQENHEPSLIDLKPEEPTAEFNNETSVNSPPFISIDDIPIDNTPPDDYDLLGDVENLDLEDTVDIEEFDAAFQNLAESRTDPHVLRTGVSKDSFKGNITDFLSTSNTVNDLRRARSSEDIFLALKAETSSDPE